MRFLEHRRYRKMVRRLLHEARHARNMREDVCKASDIERLDHARRDLKAAWAQRARPEVDHAARRLQDAMSSLYPTRDRPWLREHLEILVVAVAVAMGVRTFFVQPFKIPTGSMQPTLYGIHYHPQAERAAGDYFPLNLARLALFGQRYVEEQARVAGRVSEFHRHGHDILFRVGSADHAVNRDLFIHVQPGDYVTRGQVLASGRRTIGDHLFVNKVAYNLRRPRRGDIFVFDTTGILHPQIVPHSFYIKRLAGMPGEKVSLDPPYLLADGQRMVEPEAVFQRLLSRADGYLGYQFPREGAEPPPLIGRPGDRIALAADEFFPLGDNTLYSLDGRYFGPVRNHNVVGPAFFVYWPLSRRWGAIR